MAVQSVPSAMGLTKSPYASFAGKVEITTQIFAGFVTGESAVVLAVAGLTQGRPAMVGKTTMRGAVSGTAGL